MAEGYARLYARLLGVTRGEVPSLTIPSREDPLRDTTTCLAEL